MTTKPQSTTETLEPCPFCGSADLDLNNGYDEDANWVVVCRGCKSSGTFCVEKSKAITRWNTRTTNDLADKAVAEWFKTDFISALNPKLDRLLARLKSRPSSSASAAPVVDVKQQIADLLNEDRCMFCGGKTEHKPDCDHGVPAATAPQRSLLREPVRIDVSPPLVVSRDGVPCPDQAAALEEFKETCRSAAAAAQEQRLTPQQSAMLEQDDDMARDRSAVSVGQSGVVDLLHNTNILCRSGEGRPKVEIWFKDLKAAQRIHRWLVSITAATAAPVEHAAEVTLRIPTCAKCPFVDHSGTFTPGGAKSICGHRDAPDTFAATITGDEHYHWKYRQVDLASAPPEQCPLRQLVTNDEGAR